VEFNQPKGISKTYGKTYESSARQSFKEELGLTGDLEYLGKYGGKRNEYSLPGSHVYVMKMKPGQTIDTYRYNLEGVKRMPKDYYMKPEIEHVDIWDGHSKMEVSPSAYDIAKAVNNRYKMGWDLSKLDVKAEPGSNHVAKVRDKGFADRVAKDKALTETELKQFEQMEMDWLKGARDRLLKGKPMGLKEWATAESEIGTLLELVKGRRKAVNYFNELRGKNLTEGQIASAVNQLKEQGVLSTKAQKIIGSKKPGQKFTDTELKTLTEEIRTATDLQMKQYQKTLDSAGDDYYHENSRFYRERYVSNLSKLTRAALGQYREGEARFEPIDKIRERYNEMYDEVRSGQVRPYEEKNAVPYEGRISPHRKESPPTARSYIPEDVVYSRPRISEVERARPIVTTRPHRPSEFRRPSEPRVRPEEPRVERAVTERPPRVPPERPPRVPPERPPRVPPERPPRVPLIVPPEVPPEIPPVMPPKRPPPIVPKPKVKSFENLTKEQRAASIAWKQGWAYHLIPPPYTSEHVLHSSKPFPGVRIHDGPKSAFKSLVRIKGPILPEKILWDLGIMDITFEKGKAGQQPTMKYVPDVKQATTARRPVGMPKKSSSIPTVGGIR